MLVVPSKAAGGNSSQPLVYSGKHSTAGLQKGKVYYRLKQVDLNGVSRYSSIVSALIDQSAVSVFPNPVKDYLFLQAASATDYNFTITDINGRSIKNGSTGINKINVGYLAPGIYFLQLKTNERTTVLKFLKE